MSTKRRRALIVVTEGASWPLLQTWMAAGHLPGFRRLFQHGVAGRFVSGPVPYEVPGITSIVTGREPGEHGFYSFWAAHNRDYTPRLLEPADLLAPPLWRRPELQSLRFGLVNVYGTHPPAPINGWILSYAMNQTTRSSHPKELQWELLQRGVNYTQEVSVWYSGQARQQFLARVFETDRQRAAAGLELWERGADVAVVVLTSLDRAGHYYWQELEAGSPIAEQETALFGAFATCDSILARLSQLVDEHTSLIALSEQGFGPMRGYVSVNQLLAQAGYLAYHDAANETAIDWARTRAFEAAQGTHGINLNLVGRNDSGQVQAGDYEAVRAEVMAFLRTAVNPHTGLLLFRAVRPREEVYAGAGVANAPDIIVEPLDERYPPFGDPVWARHVNRRWQSGWHRRESYFAAIGPDFRPGVTIDGAAAIDVAPTLYQALGMTPPRELLGRVWTS